MPVSVGSEFPKCQEAWLLPVEVAMLAAHLLEIMTPDSLYPIAQNLDLWFNSSLDLGETKILFLQGKKTKTKKNWSSNQINIDFILYMFIYSASPSFSISQSPVITHRKWYIVPQPTLNYSRSICSFTSGVLFSYFSFPFTHFRHFNAH